MDAASASPTASPGMHLSIETTVGSSLDACVSLLGEVDAVSVPALVDEFTALIAAGCRRITVDMRRLSFCGIAGLDALLAAHHRVRDLGQSGDGLVVVAPPPSLRTLLRVFAPSNCFTSRADLPG